MTAKIETPIVPVKDGKGHCPICRKWITLIHKTKTRPQGARFHDHQDIIGRRCYGSPYYRPLGY